MIAAPLTIASPDPELLGATLNIMLVKESHADVTTTINGVESPMRIFVFHPTIPQYPNACVTLPDPLLSHINSTARP